MNGSVASEMTVENTFETCTSGPANCTHENVKKARKLGRVCGLCHKRVFKFWRTRKCVDCKAVFHKKCVTALETENAERNATTNPVAAMEVKTSTPIETTTTEVVTKQRLRGGEIAPLYVTPAPWRWANMTTVTVDCRRRPTPLTVLVTHGHRLSVDMFRGLFDLLPVRRPRTSTPSSTSELVVAARTPRPQRRRRSAERSDAGPREAGDWRQIVMEHLLFDRLLV